MTEHQAATSLNRPVTRRTFLQGTTLAGFAAFLAACGPEGVGGQSQGASTEPSVAPSGSTGGEIGGELNFSNWIGYIDVAEDQTTHPTLDKFSEETGITVNYNEDVDDNETYFSKIQGPLGQSLPIEADIFVVTDWMVARLVRLGWLETIDTANTPNFPANLADQYHGRSFDPDTNLAAPWQSGMTGIGFDKAQTGDLDSLDVFWDETYKGKLTYLTEMRDTVGLAAIKLGFDPATITEDQFQQSLDLVDEPAKAGLVRQLTGNSYVDVMASGDAIVAMAWSGDVTGWLQPDQTAEQDFQWALPKEGGMLWTDNMVMPKGVANKAQAEAWINFYYDPANAAAIEAWVNYVCPVKGAREELIKIDPALGDNPLIFPPDADVARLHQFRGVTEDEETQWAEDFSRVLGL